MFSRLFLSFVPRPASFSVAQKKLSCNRKWCGPGNEASCFSPHVHPADVGESGGVFVQRLDEVAGSQLSGPDPSQEVCRGVGDRGSHQHVAAQRGLKAPGPREVGGDRSLSGGELHVCMALMRLVFRAQNNSWPFSMQFSTKATQNLILFVSNCTDGQSTFHCGQPNPKPYFQLCMFKDSCDNGRTEINDCT